MSGFFNPAAAKMSTASPENTGPKNDLADRVVELLLRTMLLSIEGERLCSDIPIDIG